MGTTVQPKSGLNRQESTVPSIPKVGHQAPAQKQTVKSSNDKEKSLPVPANKKIGQAQKSVAGTGGSLKNMWGRVPVKTEDDSVKNNDTSGLLSNLFTPVFLFLIVFLYVELAFFSCLKVSVLVSLVPV